MIFTLQKITASGFYPILLCIQLTRNAQLILGTLFSVVQDETNGTHDSFVFLLRNSTRQLCNKIYAILSNNHIYHIKRIVIIVTVYCSYTNISGILICCSSVQYICFNKEVFQQQFFPIVFHLVTPFLSVDH